MIQKIIKDLKEPVKGKTTINIILCDNNLLLCSQTSERVKFDLKEFELNGELYLELSSHKRTAYHDAMQVIGAITTKPIKNVLCCTNGIRIEDIYTIIRGLNEGPLTKDKFIFKVWLDEADKHHNYIDNTFRPLVDEYENIYVYLITATPTKLFNKYKDINVYRIENTTTPEYHGWLDNDIRYVDMEGASVSQFTNHVLSNMGSEFIRPGKKWIIHAEYKKSSHLKVKDICIDKGFAVFIVNGEGLNLYLPDKQLYRYKKDNELNKMILKIYREKSLDKYPLAITGNVCIGRGLSILSEDFMIDCGIFCSCNNKQEASQNAGRLKGNIKKWKTYKKPIVFTTIHFDKVVRKEEQKSRKLAELAYSKETVGDSALISNNEFKTLGEEHEHIVHPDLFLTFKDAKQFLATKGRDMAKSIEPPVKCKETSTSIHRRLLDPLPKGTKVKNGYALSSRMGKSIEEITQNDRITLNNIPGPSFGISSNKGTRYLILPIYKDLDVPYNREEYQVRYIKFKK